MAQTKTKAAKKRAAPKRTKSTSKTSKAKTSKAKPKSARSKAQSSTNGASSKSRSNGSSGNHSNADVVRHAVGDKAKSAGKAVGKAASKARVPLVAGGAAIAGAAGGMALAASKQSHKSGLGKAVARRPKIKVTSKDVAKAAKEVGNFSAQVGELADELQRARETADGKHRSPVEVVLQGLTARR